MRKEEGRGKGREQERREMIQRCDVLTVCACVEWGADGLAQGVVERAERGIIGGFMTVCFKNAALALYKQPLSLPSPRTTLISGGLRAERTPPSAAGCARGPRTAP